MPPSGYSSEQAGGIADFLRSCSVALRAEARVSGATPVEALRAECASIRVILDEDFRGGDLSRAVLELTFAFYDNVAKQQPNDWSAFELAVAEALQDASVAIRTIHVPATAVARTA